MKNLRVSIQYMKSTKIKILAKLLEYGWFLRRKGWWYKFPFIPIPPTRYLLWRFETAWGIQSENPRVRDFPPLHIMLKDIWNFGRWLHMIDPKRR